MKKVKISDIVEVFNGYAFDSDSFNSDGKGLPIIRIRDVVPGYSETYYSGDYPKEYLIDNGALLVGMDGEFNIEFWKGGKALLNQRVCQIIPKDSADILFLKYRLSLLLKKIEDETPFVTVKHLSSEKLKDEVIEIPPLTEQKRIASLLARADRLRHLRRTAHDLGESLLQSVFLEMFGDPYRNEKKWKKKNLGALAKWRSGGTPSRENPEYFQGNIPWLSSGELEQMYTYSSNEHISEDALKKSNATKIEIGSLLLGMYDTAALKSTINQVVCTCNQAIAYAKFDESKINTVFVYWAIQVGKEDYRRLQRGVRQKNLNLSMIQEISIPVPPLNLQEEFAGVVARVESLRGRMSEGERQVEGLFESLLAGSFS